MTPQVGARSMPRPSASVWPRAPVLLTLMMLLGGCVALPDTRNTSQATPAPHPGSGSSVSIARDPALDALVARQERVYKIAAPLITKNAVLCRAQARPLLGFTAKNQYSYPPELMASARRTLGLDDRLQVMQVLDGSGAMRAGLARGEIGRAHV